jgi:hypothetical protein
MRMPLHLVIRKATIQSIGGNAVGDLYSLAEPGISDSDESHSSRWFVEAVKANAL